MAFYFTFLLFFAPGEIGIFLLFLRVQVEGLKFSLLSRIGCFRQQQF